MAETNKELLDHPSKPSVLEGLILGRNDSRSKSQTTTKKDPLSDYDKGRVLTTEIPKSQVLGKVKDFLGVMAKANEKLELNAQSSARSDYDIEVLTGNEREYIEMDLLLGVADLHTPEAVAAAEAATLGSFQPSVTSTSGSSCSDTEDDSDEESDSGDENMKASSPGRKSDPEDPRLGDNKTDDKPSKRPKIVVLN